MMSAPSSAVSGRYGEASRRCAREGRWRGSVPEELAELLEDFIADALAMVGIDVPHVVLSGETETGRLKPCAFFSSRSRRSTK